MTIVVVWKWDEINQSQNRTLTIIRDIIGHRYRKRLSKISARHPGWQLLKVTRPGNKLLAPVWRVGGHFMPCDQFLNSTTKSLNSIPLTCTIYHVPWMRHWTAVPRNQLDLSNGSVSIPYWHSKFYLLITPHIIVQWSYTIQIGYVIDGGSATYRIAIGSWQYILNKKQEYKHELYLLEVKNAVPFQLVTKSGWPSGLRRCVQVAVWFSRRGFESHFWQRFCDHTTHGDCALVVHHYAHCVWAKLHSKAIRIKHVFKSDVYALTFSSFWGEENVE